MRMRQSLAQLERAFVEEIHQDRDRRESLRRAAAARARNRRLQRETKRELPRFVAALADPDRHGRDRDRRDVQALYLVMG